MIRKIPRIKGFELLFALGSAILFLYLLFFIIEINFKAPLIGEDFALSIPYSHREDDLVEKSSLVLRKIIAQSTEWNARLGEQLAIVFLAADKSLFNILNIVVTLLFFFLVLVYAIGDIPTQSWTNLYLISLLISVFLLLPLFGDILFWISVSTNYLWSTCVLLIFLLPYRLWCSGKDIFRNSSVTYRLLFVPISIFAGMTNENTVIAVVIIVIAAFILERNGFFRIPSIPKWYWQNLALLLIGYSYLLFSPSTKIRRNYYSDAFGIPDADLTSYLSKLVYLLRQYISFSKNLLLIIAIFAVLFFLLKKWYGWKLDDHNNNLAMVILITVCSFSSVIALLAAPYFESRSLLLNWFFLLVSFVTIINELYFRKRMLLLLTIPLLIIGVTKTSTFFGCFSKLADEANARHQDILMQVSNGSQYVEVQGISTKCTGVLSDREDWLLQFAHDEVYYGVDDIIITNP